MPFFHSVCPPLRHKLSLKVVKAARNGISMQSCATNQDFLYRRPLDYQIHKWGQEVAQLVEELHYKPMVSLEFFIDIILQAALWPVDSG
jgi:hypothetical protein